MYTKYTLPPAQCTLYTVHCTLYTVSCTLYTVHFTLHLAPICQGEICLVRLGMSAIQCTVPHLHSYLDGKIHCGGTISAVIN